LCSRDAQTRTCCTRENIHESVLGAIRFVIENTWDQRLTVNYLYIQLNNEDRLRSGEKREEHPGKRPPVHARR